MMKLISWNVAGRSREKVDAQVQALMLRAPQIVALQEVTMGTARLFRDFFSRNGLPHVVTSFELATDPSLLIGPRRCGELIASRFPLDALSPSTFQVPWTERILSVQVAAPFGVVEMHTTHIPPGSSNFWIKIEMLEGLYAQLAHETTVLRVLCGDFNTPQEERASGELVTWGQHITKTGRVVCRRRIRGGTGEHWDDGERKVLHGLAAYNLRDVYRALHGYTPQEFSWYLRRGAYRVGRRFDHIFASASLNPVSCLYLHEFRESGLSDHSAIEVVFQPQPNSGMQATASSVRSCLAAASAASRLPRGPFASMQPRVNHGAAIPGA
jgi:exodeoxyribonuclease III